MLISVTKDRDRDISMQPPGGFLEGRHFTDISPCLESNQQFAGLAFNKKAARHAEEDLIDTTIQAEIEFKCTRNGCILEVVDTITGSRSLLGAKETLIFIGTYFGNLVVYKIVPR